MLGLHLLDNCRNYRKLQTVVFAVETMRITDETDTADDAEIFKQYVNIRLRWS